MIATLHQLIAATTLLGSAPAAPGGLAPAVGTAEVELELIFEQNATDADAEVVLQVDTDVGLDRLSVFDPFHRRILRLASDDRLGLGLSEVLLETAEPDIAQVQAAYPEGTYHVLARVSGQGWIHRVVELSHDLPALPVITAPGAGQTVPAKGAVVTWQADPAVESWTVEVEQDDLGISLNLVLPGGSTSFAFPDGLLVSGEEFELGIAATAENGNVLVVETSFQVR
jgi:hypothetical protein